MRYDEPDGLERVRIVSSAAADKIQAFGGKRWTLPPLILHPFADQKGPEKLLDSSRASLMLHGLMPADQTPEDELNRRLIEGRLCELRMLYFVGKDLVRWMEHCTEFAGSIEELKYSGIRQQSFADFLTGAPPVAVADKLRTWGVADYRSIFSRAIALYSIFAAPPGLDAITADFARNYYRYADHLFAARQQMQPFTEIRAANFHFDLYASGEYSRLLEKAWSED